MCTFFIKRKKIQNKQISRFTNTSVWARKENAKKVNIPPKLYTQKQKQTELFLSSFKS